MKTAHNFKNDHLCPRCASAVSDVHCLEYGMVLIPRDSLHYIVTILESHPTRRKYGFINKRVLNTNQMHCGDVYRMLLWIDSAN